MPFEGSILHQRKGSKFQARQKSGRSKFHLLKVCIEKLREKTLPASSPISCPFVFSTDIFGESRKQPQPRLHRVSASMNLNDLFCEEALFSDESEGTVDSKASSVVQSDFQDGNEGREDPPNVEANGNELALDFDIASVLQSAQPSHPLPSPYTVQNIESPMITTVQYIESPMLDAVQYIESPMIDAVQYIESPMLDTLDGMPPQTGSDPLVRTSRLPYVPEFSLDAPLCPLETVFDPPKSQFQEDLTKTSDANKFLGELDGELTALVDSFSIPPEAPAFPAFPEFDPFSGTSDETAGSPTSPAPEGSAPSYGGPVPSDETFRRHFEELDRLLEATAGIEATSEELAVLEKPVALADRVCQGRGEMKLQPRCASFKRPETPEIPTAFSWPEMEGGAEKEGKENLEALC